MPFIQIDTALWAVMRYPTDHPVAMILGLANSQNVPQYFVQTWHPDPSRRRVVSQHNSLEEANRSVRYDHTHIGIESVTTHIPAEKVGG